MTFYWFDLLQVVVILSLMYFTWKLFKKEKSKLAIIPLGFILVIAFLPPVNTTKEGFGSIERLESTIEKKPLPEKVIVEPKPSFEERVKEDLEEYKKDRKNETIN